MNRPNPLAEELNGIIQRENPGVYEMLSDLGKQLYFPKGILSQTAEAKIKAQTHNATIGIAKEGNRPMGLSTVVKHFNDLKPEEVLPYAPASGLPELRKKWKEALIRKNPLLAGKNISLPIVTNGVTHALGIAADMFADTDSVLVLPDKYWGNYNLTFAVRRGIKTVTFPFFNESGGFNLGGFEKVLISAGENKKVITVLNFPNNPTGYTPLIGEMKKIYEVVLKYAESGRNIVVITDDSYFGLFYEPDVSRESIFSSLADSHKNILAIKVDGATKEQFVWGFRTGFITFSTRVPDASGVYEAMEKKVSGLIRATISNCSLPGQTIVLKSMSDPEFDSSCSQKREILKTRFKEVKRILSEGCGSDYWVAYPFNSGYFMCLRMKNISAEEYRKHLLKKYGVGVISIGAKDIRVAFSSVEKSDLRNLFEVLEKAAKDMSV